MTSLAASGSELLSCAHDWADTAAAGSAAAADTAADLRPAALAADAAISKSAARPADADRIRMASHAANKDGIWKLAQNYANTFGAYQRLNLIFIMCSST